MKAFVSLCLVLPLLAGCTEDPGIPLGLVVSVRELGPEEPSPSGWSVDVDQNSLDSLPDDLQELLQTAAVRGNASQLYTDDSSQPIFDWVDEQWQEQGGEGEAKEWPTLVHQERRFAFSYYLT